MSANNESVQILNVLVSKLDNSIDKISDVIQDIGKIIAVHDQRIDSVEKAGDGRSNDIKEIHSRITTSNREICDKIDGLESKIESELKENAANSRLQHESIKTSISTEIKDIEGRVRALEQWRWYVLGAAATVGFLITKLPAWLKL